MFEVNQDKITHAALQFMLHDEIEAHVLATPEEAYARVSTDSPRCCSFHFAEELRTIDELTGKLGGARVHIVTDTSDEMGAPERV
ncbi:hypothetical protein Q3C01_31925 [Bradyrhizobium sp. UFLA05-109]